MELIADETPSPPNARLRIGLLFHLDSGWHIYWQNAGDSGEPPKITWSLPAGFVAGPIEWPAPKRLGSGSIIDYGYENQVLLTAPIRTPMRFDSEDHRHAELAADVKYVVCREICIPGKAHLSLTLPVSDAVQAREWHEQFEEARAQIPNPFPAAWKITAESKGDNFVLTVGGAGFDYVKSATFFPEDASVIENSAPQGAGAFGKPSLILTLRKSDQLAKQPTSLRGVLIMDGRAYKIDAPLRSNP
jgi:DsbC/DsbD-like thiol-disulfide interchange protein